MGCLLTQLILICWLSVSSNGLIACLNVIWHHRHRQPPRNTSRSTQQPQMQLYTRETAQVATDKNSNNGTQGDLRGVIPRIPTLRGHRSQKSRDEMSATQYGTICVHPGYHTSYHPHMIQSTLAITLAITPTQTTQRCGKGKTLGTLSTEWRTSGALEPSVSSRFTGPSASRVRPICWGPRTYSKSFCCSSNLQESLERGG